MVPAAYCQDNEISWFDWTLLTKHADVHRFVKPLSAQRLSDGIPLQRQRLSLNQRLRKADRAWHGVRLGQPDWSFNSHSLAFTAYASNQDLFVHVILNEFWEQLEFELPRAGDRSGDPWRRWIDTSLNSPQDIAEWQSAPTVSGFTYRAGPRSVAILFADAKDGSSPIS
jgi:isoamylase